MPEPKSIRWERRIFWTAVIVLAFFFIAGNINTFWNLLKVVIGFGFMIIVHEFGHFIVAKLSDINVQAFSIGFPPTLLGVKRTEKGYRINILPKTDEEGKTTSSVSSFTLGKKAKPGETEYRIGLIPFGGFVKMLGQEDIGRAKTTDDPRSYANKPVGVRFGVLSAGVFLNLVSAVVFFIIAFLVGVDFPPPVVGGVEPGYPAAKAGLKGGDEIVEIEGKSKYLDFSDLMLSAALADWAEEIPVKVKHHDGSVEKLYLTSEQKAGDPMSRFGIAVPMSLKIGPVSDVNELEKTTNLRPGDRIISVNDKDVDHFWQLEDIISNTYSPKVSMLAERQYKDKTELIDTQIPLAWTVKSNNRLSHICSLVPRMKVQAVSQPKRGFIQQLISTAKTLLAKAGIGEKPTEYVLPLKPNDIIISVADVNFPTYDELGEITADYENKDLSMTVLRRNDRGVLKPVSLTVRPMNIGGRVIIGFVPVLDVEHPVVADTIEIEGKKLDIPRGAAVTKVNNVEVSDLLGLAKYISENPAEKIVIEYLSPNGSEGETVIEADSPLGGVNMSPTFAAAVPFDQMQRTYKAEGPVEAVAMGFTRTTRLILTTYATLKSLIQGRVGTESMMGPVGILHASYYIVSEEPVIKYVYFIGILSSIIAVFNFLPLPPLDGGLAVFLLVEKIKGSPVNTKIQTAAATAGWILIGAVFIYVTFNDIARMIFR